MAINGGFGLWFRQLKISSIICGQCIFISWIGCQWAEHCGRRDQSQSVLATAIFLFNNESSQDVRISVI
ncbi:hypothetical protein GFL28_28340 [Rhizobium leguminosarum bv. viciae]|uniref:Uncharacterized protein n=1 Tax=Rhizobium leguminosarum TaxID=384 RepID=A0A7M3DPD7_RHILE|nr:hypothetical protein [Rhizobium leguminosarum bv. viciae]TAY50514.1 hypothetical protein ELH90_01715 [Rhizobium leguminosarum]